MRLRRLDLVRYGHFTNASLDFAPQATDLHIILGANEAGKTTAMTAIDDLLFGIPHNSHLNFLHEYSSMRIGALLESDGRSLDLLRRKGNRETLLTAEGLPISGGDGALAPFLLGADREFFERMFSLDHARLREGGRVILEARDDVGQMLFSAGAGIAGLRDRLKELDSEALSLWSPRRAAGRVYYQAEDRFKTAEHDRREHTLTATDWHSLKHASDLAEGDYDALESQIAERSIELRKTSRIRRVFRSLSSLSHVDADILALGSVPALPTDATEQLERAMADQATAATKVDLLGAQLKVAEHERALLQADDNLLSRAEEIQHLDEWRIRVVAERTDLKARREELTRAQGQLRLLADELGWADEDTEAIRARVPSRAKLVAARALLNQRGEVFAAAANAEHDMDVARALVESLQKKLVLLPAQLDFSMLAAAIKAVRHRGDIASELRGERAVARDLGAEIESRIAALKPAVADVKTLASLSVPSAADIRRYMDDRRELENRVRSCSERIQTLEDELTLDQRARDRIVTDEHAVSAEDITSKRKHRDALWVAIKAKHIEPASSELDPLLLAGIGDADLPITYEETVQQADAAADLRFDGAEAAARLADLSRKIAEKQDAAGLLARDLAALREEGERLETAWREMWKDAPFEPVSPEGMLEWTATRDDAEELAAKATAATARVAELESEETSSRKSLLSEMKAARASIATLKDKPLAVVVEAASDVLSACERAESARRDLAQSRIDADADVSIRDVALERAETKRSEWESRWQVATTALGVSAANHEAIVAQIDMLDDMREVALRVDDLQHERIDKIEADIASFGSSVAEFIGNDYPDLVKLSEEKAALELAKRSNEASRTAELCGEKDDAISDLGTRIGDLEESGLEAAETIASLQRAAQAEDLDQLKAVIGTSIRLNQLQIEKRSLESVLAQEGDGLARAELDSECEGANVDELAAREDALERELEELRERLMLAREDRTRAREAIEAVGSDDAAARDASDRQAALADMEAAAAQYVRTRSAAVLLEWAIDRYRREKQGPLLRRAGDLFAILTTGSFAGLQMDFGERDLPHLVGIRPDDQRVETDGMSDGARDQLYLALRVAAIEDYLERAVALPFVADDLFVNFDNERAAAGFRVLADLAQKTQVLFFTHHQHLVEIAQAALEEVVPVVELP